MNPVHWSDLKHIQQSPAHYRHHMDSKGTGPDEQTAAMRMGSLVNFRVFGTTAHPTTFATWTGGDKRTKEWKEFKAAHDGDCIITVDESMTADAIVGELKRHTTAWYLLSGGVAERQINWQVADRDCAGTPDVMSNAALVDLKVTNNANPDRFMWHAVRMGWLGQLAWYRDGALAAGYPDPGPGHIVAVEAKPPHVVTVFDLTEMASDFGRKQWRLLFERLLTCERANRWPGYCVTSTALDAPDTDSFLLDIEGEEVEFA